jgi:hypothetical protein
VYGAVNAEVDCLTPVKLEAIRWLRILREFRLTRVHGRFDDLFRSLALTSASGLLQGCLLSKFVI